MSDNWIPNPRPYPERPPNDWPAFEPPPPEKPVPAQEPEAAEGRAKMILAVIGVALAAAIVTYLVLRVVHPPKRKVVAPPTTIAPSSTTSTTTTLPQGPALTQATLDQLTRTLVPFVEKTRQLHFTSPPHPVLDDNTAYTKAFETLLRRDDVLMHNLETPFKVLGMNPNELDLSQAMRRFYGDKTVAFYDTVTDQLHVRAVPATPYVSVMLVETLTEQLDDQHFTTDGIFASSGYGDNVVGLRTLVQGDGWRIASLWAGTRSSAENAEIRSEIKSRTGLQSDTSQIPSVLAAWLRMPSDSGVPFTTNLVTATSSAPLNAVFASPPDGSAQVIAFGRYQSSEPQLEVRVPTVDGKVLASGTFGQFFLDAMLQPVVSDDDRALAMSGYRGDAMVAYDNGSGSCVRLDVTTGDSSPAHMEDALKAWAAQRQGTVTLQADQVRPGRQVVRLDVCSPSSGGNGGSTTTSAPSSAQPSPSTLPGGRRNPA